MLNVWFPERTRIQKKSKWTSMNACKIELNWTHLFAYTKYGTSCVWFRLFLASSMNSWHHGWFQNQRWCIKLKVVCWMLSTQFSNRISKRYLWFQSYHFLFVHSVFFLIFVKLFFWMSFFLSFISFAGIPCMVSMFNYFKCIYN